MFPVMSSASKINGIAFCALLLVMFIYSLPAVYDFSKSQTQAQSLELFLDGKLLRKFEQRYDKQFFIRDSAVKLWASTQYLLFNEGAQGVVLGNDGWLYTSQEYLVPNDLSANLQQQVEQIAKVQTLLQEHGKRLIMLPVPMKLDIYAQHARQPPDPRAVDLYQRFSQALQHRQIQVTNLRDAFLNQRDSSRLFLKTDTHWSPFGANLAAQEVARQNPQLRGTIPYASHVVDEKSLKGDLMNYILFDQRLAPWPYRTAIIPLYETLNAAQTVSEDNLFGDSGQSIAVVGSSYTKIEDWNFLGFLKEALQNDLVSVAVEARGPFQAMTEFTASKLFDNDSIHTVIWEFPVRTVLAQQAGEKSWQAVQPQHF